MRNTIALPLLLLLTGCGTIVVDNITVMEDDYTRARDKVLTVAAGDLACPRDQLATKVLRVDVHATVTRFGVKGCDTDVVFARTDDSFAIEKTPPPPEN